MNGCGGKIFYTCEHYNLLWKTTVVVVVVAIPPTNTTTATAMGFEGVAPSCYSSVLSFHRRWEEKKSVLIFRSNL